MSSEVRFGDFAYFSGVRVFEFTYSDTTNKVLGPLSETPSGISESMLFGGRLMQDYSVDYTLREVLGGTNPGWYVCVSTTSTAPGGGVFSGGVNPGTGIVVIEVGDTFRLFVKTS